MPAHNLEVIVALDAGAVTGDMSGAARHGVWLLSTSGGPAGASMPLGFWEVFRNEPVADVRIAAAGSLERVITSGSYGTFRWSWSLNSVLLARRAAWLLVDALRRLPPHAAPVAEAHPQPTAGTVPDTPGVGRGLVALTLCYWRVLSEALRRSLSDERWRLLLVEATQDGRPARAPRVIEPPPHSYWADPFVVRRGTTSYVFFEEYLYGERRGVISYIEVPDGELDNPVLRPTSHRVLDDGHHLSYPFLFRHSGELYMIPESSAVGRVDLWRCSELPGVWRRERTLIEDVSAADFEPPQLERALVAVHQHRPQRRRRPPQRAACLFFGRSHPRTVDAAPVQPGGGRCPVSAHGGRISRDGGGPARALLPGAGPPLRGGNRLPSG